MPNATAHSSSTACCGAQTERVSGRAYRLVAAAANIRGARRWRRASFSGFVVSVAEKSSLRTCIREKGHAWDFVQVRGVHEAHSSHHDACMGAQVVFHTHSAWHTARNAARLLVNLRRGFANRHFASPSLPPNHWCDGVPAHVGTAGIVNASSCL